MTPQEVAALLTAVAAIDDRVDPDAPRVAMWIETLDKSMPFEFARAMTLTHYASTKSPLMPADLNLPWRQERNRQIERDQSNQLLALQSQAVPMPDDVKVLLADVLKVRPA